jgi:hypothetical protein
LNPAQNDQKLQHDFEQTCNQKREATNNKSNKASATKDKPQRREATDALKTVNYGN